MPARARLHERTAIAVRGEHHGACPVTSAAAEATSRRRETHTGRGSRQSTAEAVQGITQTARNLRVAAVGERTAIAVRGEHHGAGPVTSAAAEATSRRRETHTGRGSRQSTAEAVRGITQTARNLRVAAVGSARQRQCGVSCRGTYRNASGVTNPPTREGHTIGRRQICAQPRGTVARTTEMIAEIHYLGVYLGEFWRSAQGTRCNRGSVGPNYRVCPYSIVRC